MGRFLTLVFLLCLAIPAGITLSGCTRNPAGKYCFGAGYGLKDTDVYAITLQPQNTGISIAFGQTRSITPPSAFTCRGDAASVGSYTYGTSNNKLVDISPTGTICAGVWNRNSGGGIADYTICNIPSPLPTTTGLPYASAFITASAKSVTSNPVQIFVHAQVSSISLVGPDRCLSQTEQAPLDAQACYASNGTQYLMCAPSTVVNSGYVCPLAPGVASVPNCTSAIGTLSYNAGSATVASINPETNQITAQLPGTTVITATVAGAGSSAGYFSTCPPKSISLTLNGSTTGTVTPGVQQNLVTKVYDANIDTSNPLGHLITGLTLDYQSTNPIDISVGASGAVSALFPGAASIYAICQPSTCNPAPINQVGVFGTGLSISSNAVDITTPGTASSYVWYSAPGKSQYFVPVELLTGTVGSTVRLPYVPNSMVIDRLGNNIYFGSSHELMVYNSSANTLTTENPSVPGVVLAVAPNNSAVLINDPIRKVFYIASSGAGISATFGGLGTSAQWTPDSKTLYVSDSAAANNLPANIAAGITGHTDTLYVYNANTGWTTSCSITDPTCKNPFAGATNLAITVPGVGAYLSGNPTVAHTWCPTGTAGNYASMQFYPEGASVPVPTDVLAATIDGQHILGAAVSSAGTASFTDIGVSIPNGACPAAVGQTLQPLTIPSTPNLNQAALSVSATAVNQVVTSPAAVNQGTAGPPYSLSFITYTGSTAGATLPYYKLLTGSANAPGTIGYLSLTGVATITAPVAGAFSPDNALFFVSTSGDNKVHYIDTTTLTDTQQISPNLPACTPGADPGCVLTAPATSPVPATAIVVKPRSTT